MSLTLKFKVALCHSCMFVTSPLMVCILLIFEDKDYIFIIFVTKICNYSIIEYKKYGMDEMCLE